MVRCPLLFVVVHTFKPEYLWSRLANLDQILCVVSLGVGRGSPFSLPLFPFSLPLFPFSLPPTSDGLPIKKITTTHMIKTKKSVMNCAFWLELTQIRHNFWTCKWIFCWNIQCLTIYIGDWYFFRYGHVWFDTNINPQVLVFDKNHEPVPAPIFSLDFGI